MKLSQEKVDDLICFATIMLASPINEGSACVFFGADYDINENENFNLLVGNKLAKDNTERSYFYIRFSDMKIVGECLLSENAVQELKDWITLKKDLLIRLELCNLDESVYPEYDSILEQIES